MNKPVNPAPQAFPEERNEMVELWNTVVDHKWVVLGITSLFTIAAFFHYSQIPNVYTAEAQVIVEKMQDTGDFSKHTRVPTLDDIANGGTGDADYYKTRITILESNKTRETVMAELGEEVPGYSFSAKRIQDTSILKLTVECGDPGWAARIANKYAEVFIRESSKEQTFITEQFLQYLPDAESLEAAASEKDPLRRSRFLSSRSSKLNDMNPNFNKDLFSESLDAISSDPVIESLRREKIQSEHDLDDLLQRYKPGHPSVIDAQRRLETIDDKLKDRMKTVLNNLRAVLAGEMKIYNIRILEDAKTPDAPSAPDRPRGILIVTFWGFFISTGWVFLLDFLNQKVMSQKDLLSVPLAFLGYVPFSKDILKTKRKGARTETFGSLMNSIESDSVLADAIVNVRTHILFSISYERSKRIMITSALPGEGKTTVSALLGLSFAALGRKILLVDADMRKSTLDRYLNLKNDVGLSDYLLGVATLEDIIQTIPGSSLQVITAGATMTPYAPELLSSETFRNFLDYATANYDRVVVDVPPALHIPDALIVAKYIHTGILICSANMVYKKMVTQLKEKFDSVNLSLIGGVINRADYKKEDYYSQKYYKYYGTVPGKSKTQPIQKPRMERWRFAEKFNQSEPPAEPPSPTGNPPVDK